MKLDFNEKVFFLLSELSSHCKAAEKFGINPTKLTKLKYRLLDQWLPEKVAHASSMDETITNFDFLQNMNHTEGGANDEIANENASNFLRCVYILQGCECYDYMISVWNTKFNFSVLKSQVRILNRVVWAQRSGSKRSKKVVDPPT